LAVDIFVHIMAVATNTNFLKILVAVFSRCL